MMALIFFVVVMYDYSGATSAVKDILITNPVLILLKLIRISTDFTFCIVSKLYIHF
jgi:hypothetical protein